MASARKQISKKITSAQISSNDALGMFDEARDKLIASNVALEDAELILSSELDRMRGEMELINSLVDKNSVAIDNINAFTTKTFVTEG